jgi:hypothetical protein
MEIQPSPRPDQDIESRDDSPQPIRPQDDNPQPIVIRKLDRVETTRSSSMNGG